MPPLLQKKIRTYNQKITPAEQPLIIGPNLVPVWFFCYFPNEIERHNRYNCKWLTIPIIAIVKLVAQAKDLKKQYIMHNNGGDPKTRFDFENGYLINSPCKQCDRRPDFPGCIQHCQTLDHIQKRLACGVLTTHNYSAKESYAVLLDEGQKK